MFHPNSEKGVGTVELLICGPALMALLFLAYEINQRIDNASSATITSRNALFSYVEDQGSLKRSHDAFAENLLPSRSDKRGSIIAPELNETGKNLVNKSTRESSFIHLDSQGGHEINDLLPAVKLGSDIEISDLESRKFLKKLSSGEGDAIDFAYQMISPARSLFEKGYGLNLTNRTRRGNVEYRFNYKNHSLVQSIAMLSGSVGSDREKIDPEFKSYSQASVEELNGYHLGDGVHPALIGAGVGFLLKGHWMAQSSFSTSSNRFQTRCMSRFTMEDTCEEQPGRGRRGFLNKISTIATIRTLIGDALIAASGVTFGATGAIELALEQAVQKVISEVVNKALESLSQTLENELKRQLIKNLPMNQLNIGEQFERKLTELESKYDLDWQKMEGSKP